MRKCRQTESPVSTIAIHAFSISHDTAAPRHTPLEHVMLKLEPVSTGSHAEKLVLVTGIEWYQVSHPEAEVFCV